MEEQKPFGLYPKQVEVMTTVRDARKNGVDEIFLIGPIGSTKTFAMALTHINIANEFKNCIIPVGRKDLSEAQIGTWEVYQEALMRCNYIHGKHYTTRQAPNDLRIKFTKSGSVIQFIGMNKSRDRDWSKLKITATTAGVDEVDDVDKGGYETLASRTGRRNDNGAPRVTLSACNPNDEWTKRDIYFPWLKRIDRRPDNMEQEEWDMIQPLASNKVVIEFEMEDSPLYLEGYYERFMDRPRNWKERFLKNNWNYSDDENSLFKSRTMAALTIARIEGDDTKYIAVDPNAGGIDRASIALMHGDTVVDIEVYTTEKLKKLAEPDELSPFNPGAVIGRLTVAMMKREKVGYRNVAVDAVGIGQGTVTYLFSNGYKVHQFKSGAIPYQTPEEQRKGIKPAYDMLRSQVFHKMSLAMDRRELFFFDDMAHLSALKKELQFHEGDTSAKVMKVTSKDDIKKMLGKSPDIADSVMMAYWVRMISRRSTEPTSDRITVGKSFDDYYRQAGGF